MPTDRSVALAPPRRARLRLAFGALLVALIAGPVPTALAVQPPLAAPAPVTVTANERAENVIAAARAYVDVPYRVGTEGPYLFDCSGLVFRAFADAGELGRIGSARLRAAGYMRWFAARGLLTTDAEQAERGDLVIYGNGVHIGIYLGDGRVISAVVTGVTVHSIDGISVPPTGFLAVDWSGKRGPFKPGVLPLVPTVVEERPAALVPTAPWAPAAPPTELATGPLPAGTERVDMRTANSRTFQRTNGRFTTELFTRPIFYQPEGSTDWQPIDLRFQATDRNHETVAVEASPIDVELRPADADRGFLSLLAGERTLRLRLPADVVRETEALPQLANDGRYVDYHDLYGDGVGLRVFARSDGFKAFLVLREEPDRNRFEFELDAPDLLLVAEEDGSVTLRDAAEAVVGRVARPLMLDSSDIDGDGGGVHGAAVSLGVDTAQRRPVLSLTVDRAPLDEAVYPVFIDLTIVDFPVAAAGARTFISSGHPNSNFSAYQRPELPAYHELWHGRQPGSRSDNAAYLRFGELAETLAGVTVESALLRAFPYWQKDDQRARASSVNAVGEEWDVRAINWNTRPLLVTELGEFESRQGAWSDFDLTSYAQDVASRIVPDYGLMLHANGMGRDHWKRIVAESGAAAGDLEPRLVVEWSGLAPAAQAVERTAAGDVRLSWSHPGIAPAARRYQVQVSADGFKSLTAASGTVSGGAAADTTWTVPRGVLKSGKSYAWRVRAKYGDDTSWSAWSTPRTFTYRDRALVPRRVGELLAER